jgi:hypothetical protein
MKKRKNIDTRTRKSVDKEELEEQKLQSNLARQLARGRKAKESLLKELNLESEIKLPKEEETRFL